MTDSEKIIKIEKVLISFCAFNELVDRAAKESKCKPLIDYMEVVYDVTHEITGILTEREEIND